MPSLSNRRTMSRTMKRSAAGAIFAITTALALTVPGTPAQAQDVINVNPVNVPIPPMANPPASNANSAANLTPMAPTDPHAITHLPKVLVAQHNGANGIPAAPTNQTAPVPASIQHAPAYPGLTITLTGTVTGDPTSGHFYLSTNGFVYTIKANDRNMVNTIDGGDRVRVFGDVDGLIVTNANVRVLVRDASDSADSYGFGVNQ